MTNLLIVGGTGFFGKSLIKYLYESKIKKKFKKIYLLSRKKKTIKKITIKNIQVNLLTINNLPKIKYIIYLAKLKNSRKDIVAAKNFLKILEKTKSKERINLLYVSSGAVYGEMNKKKLINENYLLKNKRIRFSDSKKEDYAFSKIECEKIFLNCKIKNLDVRIARCFTFTGEFLKDKRFAIVEFINSILKKKRIIFKANHEVYRSYMYSDQLSEWLIKILFKKNIKFRVFNVGSDDKIELSKLAKILSLKFGTNLIKKNRIKKKINFYVPSVARYKRVFNFKKKQSSLSAIITTIKKINHAKTN